MATVIGAAYGSTSTPTDRPTGGRSFGLGDYSVDEVGKHWVYVQCTTALTPGQPAVITDAHIAAACSTTNALRGLRVGVPTATFAANDFGWLQVFGSANVNVLASAAANTRLNSTNTPGALDDDGSVGTKEIREINLTASRNPTTGPAPAILNFPMVGVTL